MARKSLAKTAVAAALFLSMLLVPAVMASQAQAAAQPDKFKVGVILTLSGPMAAMGLLEKDGLDIAADDINKAGGVMVQGKKIPVELLYYDDEANPKKALDAAYALINKHKVKVIVGIRMNAAIEAVQQISEKKKVLCM
ncbi:MAG: ABC transporter substrate-binding protein, partial [Pseudomonadota bacterium]